MSIKIEAMAQQMPLQLSLSSLTALELVDNENEPDLAEVSMSHAHACTVISNLVP